jgi:hypothetical protein
MEALPAIAPLVLVLRGGIMGAFASATAPEPFPHPQAPAQPRFEKADARVAIEEPIIIACLLPIGLRNRESGIRSYRIPGRRQLVAHREAWHQSGAAQLIADLP